MLLLGGEGLRVSPLTLGPLQSKEGGNDAKPLLCRSHVDLVGLNEGVAHDWGWTLASWARGNIEFCDVFCLATRVLVTATAVNRNNLIAIDAGFAYWACSAVILDLKPSIQARPAVEMAAEGDYWFRSEL